MNLAFANAPMKQGTANAQNHTNDICDPVVEVGAAVKAGLHEFDGAAVYACADEDWWEPSGPYRRAGRECGEGYQVHACRCPPALGARLQGPSIVTVRVSVTIMVRRMSKFLRIHWGV